MERQLRDFVEKTKGLVSRFTTSRARIPGIWLGESAMTDPFSLSSWIRCIENSKMAMAEARQRVLYYLYYLDGCLAYDWRHMAMKMLQKDEGSW